MSNNLETIILGSGEVFLSEFERGAEIPADAEIETDTNRIGWIKGGAALEYTPTMQEIFDDLRKVVKRFITGETVVFKTGVMTWCLSTLATLSATFTYTDDPATKIRTLKIGGSGATVQKQYFIRFIHRGEDGAEFRITIAGAAQAGFTLTFDPENPIVVDAEYSAGVLDDQGTRAILEEHYS